MLLIFLLSSSIFSMKWLAFLESTLSIYLGIIPIDLCFFSSCIFYFDLYYLSFSYLI